MTRTAAFFSYTRADDLASEMLLSKIRSLLESRVGVHYGIPVDVFQDTDDIKIGDDWRNKLEKALKDATYFIPVITPSFFNSEACRDELRRFLDKSKTEKREDLIFPILLVEPSVLTHEESRSWDHLERAIERLQWADWKRHSVRTKITPAIRSDVDNLAKILAEKLRRDDIWEASKSEATPATSPVVETKRKRVVVPKPGNYKPHKPDGNPQSRPAAISDAEMERRLKAVQAAKEREAAETAKREPEDKVKTVERPRRTKSVVVETKRKRVVVPKPGVKKSSSGNQNTRPAPISDAEMERRLKAVQAAKKQEAEAKARAEVGKAKDKRNDDR